MKNIPQLFFLTFILCSVESKAQISTGSFGFEINLGTVIPINEPSYSTGFGTSIQGNYYFSNIVSSIFLSYEIPNNDFGVTSEIFGFGGNLKFVVAPEASTNFFLGAGIGAHSMMISNKISRSSTGFYYNYSLVGGVRFAPQQWRNIFLKIKGEYKRIYFPNVWSSLGLMMGVGFDIY